MNEKQSTKLATQAIKTLAAVEELLRLSIDMIKEKRKLDE